MRGADRDDLAQLAMQLRARSRAVMASSRRSVRYSSVDTASSRPARVAASSPTWRRLVERDGLPVRPGAGSLGRSGGRVLEHPGHIARRRGVVGQHARVAADRLQRRDHRCVQRRLGTGHGRAEDRGPRDLVAERDGPAVLVDEAGGSQQADGRRRHPERVQQAPD